MRSFAKRFLLPTLFLCALTRPGFCTDEGEDLSGTRRPVPIHKLNPLTGGRDAQALTNAMSDSIGHYGAMTAKFEILHKLADEATAVLNDPNSSNVLKIYAQRRLDDIGEETQFYVEWSKKFETYCKVAAAGTAKKKLHDANMYNEAADALLAIGEVQASDERILSLRALAKSCSDYYIGTADVRKEVETKLDSADFDETVRKEIDARLAEREHDLSTLSAVIPAARESGNQETPRRLEALQKSVSGEIEDLKRAKNLIKVKNVARLSDEDLARLSLFYDLGKSRETWIDY